MGTSVLLSDLGTQKGNLNALVQSSHLHTNFQNRVITRVTDIGEGCASHEDCTGHSDQTLVFAYLRKLEHFVYTIHLRR